MIARVHSVEKSISEISENDIRIRIIGVLVDSGEDYIVVDDGTGKIEVFFRENLNNEVKTGDVVKIIGRVYSSQGSVKINGECLQILKNFNLKLYKEAKKTIEKVMENV